MKVAYYYSDSNVKIKDIDIREISDDELLIKTKSYGICVPDTMEWYLKDRASVILGHEALGEGKV